MKQKSRVFDLDSMNIRQIVYLKVSEETVHETTPYTY
jgi:hypothetical protein